MLFTSFGQIWIRNFALALIFYCASGFAIAQDSESGDVLEFSKPITRFTQTADFYARRFEGYVSEEGRTDLEVETSLNDNSLAAKFTPWLWLRAPDQEGGLSRKTRAFFEAKEGWVAYRASDVEFYLGNQMITWGAADVINPTDVWNPLDFVDPLKPTHLPITAFRAKIHPQSLEHESIDFVATPFFRPSRLPVALPDSGIQPFSVFDSRWLLTAPNEVTNDSGFSAPLQYQISEAVYPKTYQLGARVQFTQIGGWDFSVSAFDGISNIPRVATETHGSTQDPSLPIIVTLYPTFDREVELGLDGAGSVKIFGHDFGTRFELAYYIPDNSAAEAAPPEFSSQLLRDQVLWGVAGMDYTFPGRLLGSVFYSNLQYIHYQRIGNLEPPGGAAGSLVSSGLPNLVPLDDDLMIYSENRFGVKFKFKNSLLGSVRNRDGYWNPELSYQYSDAISFAVEGDVLWGNSSGFYGQFRDNTRWGVLAKLTL